MQNHLLKRLKERKSFQIGIFFLSFGRISVIVHIQSSRNSEYTTFIFIDFVIFTAVMVLKSSPLEHVDYAGSTLPNSSITTTPATSLQLGIAKGLRDDKRWAYRMVLSLDKLRAIAQTDPNKPWRQNLCIPWCDKKFEYSDTPNVMIMVWQYLPF